MHQPRLSCPDNLHACGSKSRSTFPTRLELRKAFVRVFRRTNTRPSNSQAARVRREWG